VFIESEEILLGKIAIFIGIVLVVDLVNFTLAEGTDLSHASLMVFLALRFAHKTHLTELSEYLAQNFLALLVQISVSVDKVNLFDSHLFLSNDF
jgi:hypothetical protein